MLDLPKINSKWTLFLDRDGVINVDKSPYTLNAEQFEFYKDVPQAIQKLSKIFHRIFVVTNQRGVGRMMMTEEDLLRIHDKMIREIEKAGGKINKIYYCTALDKSDPCRKPNPGMALQALKEHPDVLPHQSIIIGNNISDMLFGRNAGFHTVLLETTGTKVTLPDPRVDLIYGSLPEFAEVLANGNH